MKFGKTLQPSDIPYNQLKHDVCEDSSMFLSKLSKSLVVLQRTIDHADLQQVSRNYLACLKLAKKHEKVRECLLGSEFEKLLTSQAMFQVHIDELHTTYDRAYPQYRRKQMAQSGSYPHIIAHRGFEPYIYHKKAVIDGCGRDVQPCSSSDFRYKCAYIEIDVVLCKSGEIVLQHDRYNDKGTPLEDCNIENIEDAVTLEFLIANYSFVDTPKLMLDIKGYDREIDTITQILSVLQKYSISPERVLLSSFNEVYMKQCYHQCREYPRGLIVSGRSLDGGVGFLKTYGLQVVIVDENMICRQMVEMYKKEMIKTWVYTVNKIGRFDNISWWGIDAIITDHPNLMFNR